MQRSERDHMDRRRNLNCILDDGSCGKQSVNLVSLVPIDKVHPHMQLYDLSYQPHALCSKIFITPLYLMRHDFLQALPTIFNHVYNDLQAL